MGESLQLLLSPAMATATAVDMVDTAEDTTARGMLMLRLPPLLRPMPSLAMATTAVDTEDTMARGRLRLPLMLSLAMDIMAVDMAVMVMDVSMVDMVDMAEDTTARGRLMLRPSPDMDTTAVAMDMVATDTDVSMVDTADTTDKF